MSLPRESIGHAIYHKGKGILLTHFGALLLLLSLVLNLALAQRVRVLERTLIAIKSDGELRLGATVQPLEVRRADGTISKLRFDDVKIPTLLYVMTPKCVWCQRNTANLNALVDQAGNRYRVVVLSLTSEGIDDYRRKYELVPGILAISPKSQAGLRVGGTPTTFLISASGALLGKWVGAYDDDEKGQIEKMLAVSLPGVSESTQRS